MKTPEHLKEELIKLLNGIIFDFPFRPSDEQQTKIKTELNSLGKRRLKEIATNALKQVYNCSEKLLELGYVQNKHGKWVEKPRIPRQPREPIRVLSADFCKDSSAAMKLIEHGGGIVLINEKGEERGYISIPGEDIFDDC